MTIEITQIVQMMKAYVKDNLKDCCRELVDWDNTGILCEGKVRLAARILEPIGSGDSTNLRIAEQEVKSQAIQKVAE